MKSWALSKEMTIVIGCGIDFSSTYLTSKSYVMLYSLKSYFLLIATCVFFVSPGNAQKCMQYYRGGLSASVGVNSGFSKTTFSQDTTKRTSRLGLNLNVAYAINQTILTGIEVNAWSLSSRSFFNFDSGVRTPEANTN